MISVGVQVSYHFYQGWIMALGYIPLFAVFAVYYKKTGRAWPLILAHMVFDLIAVLRMR